MNHPVLLLLLTSLLSGWLLSLDRSGFRARTIVISSVPLGAFLGGYSGSGICWLAFRFKGVAESQHEWIAWGAAGVLGFVLGCILLPATALALTTKKHV